MGRVILLLLLPSLLFAQRFEIDNKGNKLAYYAENIADIKSVVGFIEGMTIHAENVRAGDGIANDLEVVSSIPVGLSSDDMGVFTLSGGLYAVIKDVLYSNVIDLEKIGIQYQADCTTVIETYANYQGDTVRLTFPPSVIRVLDVDFADKKLVDLHFEYTTVLFPIGSTIDVIDDASHVFDFDNCYSIHVTGSGIFDHSDTTDYNLVLPAKWNGVSYNSNRVFNVVEGADWAEYGDLHFEGMELLDSWYSLIRVFSQVDSDFDDGIPTYKNIYCVNTKNRFGVSTFSARGDFESINLIGCIDTTDQFKNRWTTENMGRNGHTQEVTNTKTRLRVKIEDCHFVYGGFFLQNAFTIDIDGCTFKKGGMWFDPVTQADSIIYDEFDVLSNIDVGVRSAGGSYFKIDHANVFIQGRSTRVNNCHFSETLEGVTDQAEAANFQLEGEQVFVRVSDCKFDNRVRVAGSPGFARQPTVTDCEFGPNAALDISDGLVSQCIFTDSLELQPPLFRESYPIDTFGTWETDRVDAIYSSTNTLYRTKIRSCDFYNRTIKLGSAEQGIDFHDCNFYGYTGIIFGDATTQPDTLNFDFGFYDCAGGRFRTPFSVSDLTGDANIDIVNHRDILIQDAAVQAIKLTCEDCTWSNNRVLDYTFGKPHSLGQERDDLSRDYIINSGSPSGILTPSREGIRVFDDTGNNWFISTGTTNTDWAQIN